MLWSNGILLTFFFYKTSDCLLMFFGRASEFPVPFTFPPLQKICTYGCPFPKKKKLPKPKPEDRRNDSSLFASSPRYSARHGPIIYGSQSTSSSVHYVHYAFKHLPFPLVCSLLWVSYSHHI